MVGFYDKKQMESTKHFYRNSVPNCAHRYCAIYNGAFNDQMPVLLSAVLLFAQRPTSARRPGHFALLARNEQCDNIWRHCTILSKESFNSQMFPPERVTLCYYRTDNVAGSVTVRVVLWNAARTALASRANCLLRILLRVGFRWRRTAPLAVKCVSVRLII